MSPRGRGNLLLRSHNQGCGSASSCRIRPWLFRRRIRSGPSGGADSPAARRAARSFPWGAGLRTIDLGLLSISTRAVPRTVRKRQVESGAGAPFQRLAAPIAVASRPAPARLASRVAWSPFAPPFCSRCASRRDGIHVPSTPVYARCGRESIASVEGDVPSFISPATAW